MTSLAVSTRAQAPPSAASTTGRAGPAPAGPAGSRPADTSRPSRPPAEQRLTAMAEAFLRLFLEVESGRRPRSQLASLMTPLLYARLGDAWVRGGVPASVVCVRIAGRSASGCDIVGLVRRGPRCTAIALHLVRGRRGWVVSELARPEVGVLPPPPFPIPSDDDADDDLPVVVRRPIARAGGGEPIGPPPPPTGSMSAQDAWA